MPNPVANLTISPATVTIPFPSPHWDASGSPVGMVPVPKTVQKAPSPRGDAPEVPVGKVAVPKTGRGPFRGRFERDCWIVRLREDAPEVPVGKVAVPQTVQKPPSPRRDASRAPVGKVPVPKTGQKPPSPPAATESKILNLSITIFKIFMAYPFGKS